MVYDRRAASTNSRRSAAPTACRVALTASGLTDTEVIPKRTRCSANSGWYGACPHSEHVMPSLTALRDDLADGVEDGCIALVEQLGADLRVPVDPEHQLREVVRADRHPVDAEGRVLGDPIDDGRDLGHDPPVQAPLTAERAGVDHLQACLELPAGADERDHEVQVRVSSRTRARICSSS